MKAVTGDKVPSPAKIIPKFQQRFPFPLGTKAYTHPIARIISFKATVQIS